jgi:hypothetical protein
VGVGLLALALRVLLMIGYTPAILDYADEGGYVAYAANGLFLNPFRPSGYSLFLRVVHWFSGNLAVTIAMQHAVGLATAVVAYAVARRIGAGRWYALVAAAIIALSGDQLYLEHILLSDGLFLTVLLVMCYCALRVRTATPFGTRVAWALAAGALAGGLVTVRTIGLPAAGVLVVWLVVAGGPAWRRRLASAGAAALLCTTLLLGYALAQENATGVFGLTRFGGWPLYGRVAPFADCTRFTPPAGTAGLCEAIPASQRPGPDFYLWHAGSPARRLFGPPPRAGAKLGAFARAAILAQPGDYLFAVVKDLARFFDPISNVAKYSGAPPIGVLLDQRQPGVEAANLPLIRSYYGAVTLHVRHGIVGALTTWQQIVRTHGWLMFVEMLLAVAGIFYAPDPNTRAGLALLLGCALAILVVTAMVAGYQYRYEIPPAALLMVAGARGAEVVVTRLGPRRSSA